MCEFCKFTRDTDFDKCPACSYEEKYVKVKTGYHKNFPWN